MSSSKVTQYYETTLKGLHSAGLDGTYPEGGAIRGGSGKLFEEIPTRIIQEEFPNLVVKQNDYLTLETGGYTNDRIQVDLHVYEKDKIKFVVECKSYLDSSMLKRAIFDFLEIKKAIGDCPRIISTGQLAIKEETLNYHRELAKELGVPFEVFVLNTSKWRKKNIGVTKTLDTLDENALNMLRGHLRNLI
tara:strand:+ start:20 stop:589 length:570 start_codon:yes stop_codon:yes gene_type:complete